MTVDQLLNEVTTSNEAPLRIYLGAAPGVGKTYRMLVDGLAMKHREVDVVVGYVETHGRAETIAQIKDLEVIPRRRVAYRGIEMEEMDLDAIISRKPKVVLIDELAHTNVPGVKNEKRYQDIEDILAHGIAVFSTCNIQHLESVHDVVERMTGVEVKEHVPDTFFALAREMIIVDVTADELQERMRAGKIYALDKVERSLENFFSRGNITLLRELALREIANDVEHKGRGDREHVSKAGNISSEKVLVAITDQPEAKRLVRAGSRIAGRMNAGWYVVHVARVGSRGGTSFDESPMLRETLQLAKSLGARIVSLEASDVADAVIRFAREEGITQIVLGASPHPWWKRLFARPVAARLLRNIGEIAVHVLPLGEPERAEQQSAPVAVKLSDPISAVHIIPALTTVKTVEQTIALLIDHLIQFNPELGARRAEISESVLRRERLMSTFLETGIAIPHINDFPGISELKVAVALTPQGVLSLDREQRAYIVVLFLSSEFGRTSHLKFLSAIARVFLDATTTREIANAPTADDALAMIKRLEAAQRRQA